jgi:hypothetical protein
VFAVLHPDGTGRTVHTEGYSDAVTDQIRTIRLDSELPVAVTLREGRPVYLHRPDIAVHANSMLRGAKDRVLAVGSVPLKGHGALAISWSGPVEMTPLVREHLEAMADSISARLDAL